MGQRPFGLNGFGWACRRVAGRIVAIFLVFYRYLSFGNSNMTAPVTPDPGGGRGRVDDRSDARSSRSLNDAAKLFEVSRYGSFCADAAVLIVESMDMLSDKLSSVTKKKKAEAAMRELAVKLADVDKALVSAAANSNKKIPGAKKAIEKIRNEEEAKSAASYVPNSGKRYKKSIAQKRVEDFEVFPDIEMEDAATAATRLQLDSSNMVPAQRVSPRSWVIPAPGSASGTFSPAEVLTILLGITNEKKNIEARKMMIEKGWVKYMDGNNKMQVMGERGLRKFWRKWRDSSSLPPDQFGRQGKPGFIDTDALIAQVRAQLKVQDDTSVCREDVADLIIKAREKSFAAAGMDVRGLDLRPTDETLRVYYSALTMKGGFKLVDSVKSLADHRQLAVNSSRNCMSQCLSAAVAQSIKVPSVRRGKEVDAACEDGGGHRQRRSSRCEAHYQQRCCGLPSNSKCKG